MVVRWGVVVFCARGIVVASTGLLSCASVRRSVASFDDAPREGGRGGLAPALTHYPFQSRVEEISDDIPCRIKFLSCCIVDMVAVSRQSACALGKDEVFGVSLGLLYPVKLHASRDTHRWTLIKCRFGAGGAMRYESNGLRLSRKEVKM